MFLGQLYYFEKELDKILISSSYTAMLDIELAGVDPSFVAELRKLNSSSQILLELKERFITGYESVLLNNGLKKSLDFWKWITSPVNKINGAIPESEFQANIVNWLRSGASQRQLKHEILIEGRLCNQEQDFALFYGLHALYKINTFLAGANDEITDITSLTSQKQIELEQDLLETPQILVIASKNVEPLVANINCVFIKNSDEVDTVKANLSKAISDNPNLNLILVDSPHPELFNCIQKLKLENILASEVSFDETTENSFFDNIVKQTLGIRLDVK
jgi:hypothetical protein